MAKSHKVFDLLTINNLEKKVKSKKLTMKQWEKTSMDKKIDKKMGYKEGSKKDVAMDKKELKKYNKKLSKK